MAETVAMPKLGFDMAEGIIVRWVKKEGESITKGDVLAEIETDKATVEVESPYTGIVAKHLVAQSSSVPVGDPIAIITTVGEDFQETKPVEKPGEKPAGDIVITDKPAAPMKSESMTEKGATPVSPSSSQPASPLARRMAIDYSIDLSNIQGTGPNGRIVRRDVEAAFAKATTPKLTAVSPGPVSPSKNMAPQKLKEERKPLSKLRAAIGNRMLESKQTIPHFYITSQVLADNLMELRQQFNNVAADDGKLSVNDFIVKASAMALLKYPALNASLVGTEILRHGEINIGIAVTIEDGLLTVVVKKADQKDIRTISTEIRDMVTRARSGKVKTDDIEGSTFSISNLGMYGVENFAAIINPPEAAILAVSAVHDAPIVYDGQIRAGKVMKITISADHRVTDGAEAAQFMQELTRLIENPVWLVM